MTQDRFEGRESLVSELLGCLREAVATLNNCAELGVVPAPCRAPILSDERLVARHVDSTLEFGPDPARTRALAWRAAQAVMAREWRPVAGPEGLLCGDVVRWVGSPEALYAVTAKEPRAAFFAGGWHTGDERYDGLEVLR